MKRDMDLIRAIMLKLETVEDATVFGSKLEIEGYDPRTLAYHCVLLHEAGFLSAISMGEEFEDVQIYHVTWDGHEFLDASRNSKTWKSVMDKVKEKAVSVPFDLLFSLLKTALGEAL